VTRRHDEARPFIPIKCCTSPAETTSTGRPAAIIWRGTRYSLRVLWNWDQRVYRIATTLSGGPAIGEIAKDDQGWRLRQWWTY
jgi:hypothetical protein